MDGPAKSTSGLRAATSRHSALIAFVLFVLMAGSNPVAVRFSNQELPPFWGGTARLAAAAVIFWIIVLARRIPLPRGRALTGALLYGLIGIGALNAIAYWTLVRVHPGSSSVFLAMVPLATVFLAAAHGQESLTGRKLAGALVAVAGIAFVVRSGLGTPISLPLLILLIGLPFALAEGAVIIRLFRPGNPMATNAVAFSVGATMLASLSLLAGEKWNLPTAAATWAALAYVIVIGSVVVFYLWLVVLSHWPASRSAYGYVLLPVVSVVISAWLTGEVITISLVLGAAVALVGVWLGAISVAPRAPVPPSQAEVESRACMPTC
jgi:drug/metabolite transporter (DMT)-like permease